MNRSRGIDRPIAGRGGSQVGSLTLISGLGLLSSLGFKIMADGCPDTGFRNLSFTCGQHFCNLLRSKPLAFVVWASSMTGFLVCGLFAAGAGLERAIRAFSLWGFGLWIPPSLTQLTVVLKHTPPPPPKKKKKNQFSD